MAPFLEIQGLTRRFGALTALDDCTVAIDAGEVVALLGANGSGKSTLLRALAGILEPTRGAFRLEGSPWSPASDAVARRLVAMLPEHPALIAELTVRRHLAGVAALYRSGRAERRQAITDAVAFAGLGDVRDQPCGTLSKGYRQRVAVASVHLAAPRVLLLDEPASGLDVAHQGLVQRLTKRALNAGGLVILSTHSLSEAERLATRILLLKAGRLREDIRAEQLRSADGASRAIVIRVGAQAQARALQVLSGRPWLTSARPLNGTSPEGMIVTEARDAADNRQTLQVLLESGVPVHEVRPELPYRLERLFLEGGQS